MNQRNKELERFFEYDVKDAIPKLIKEYANLADLTDEEENDLLKESQLKIRNQNEDGTEYVFMSEPQIEVLVGIQYAIKVADQEGERLFFRTSEIDAFIRYWNTDIVDYFGQNVRFPEINNI